MKEAKPWQRALRIVERCKRGERLCCFNQQTETGGSEIVYFFEPGGYPVGRKSVENALQHGLIVPQNDGLRVLARLLSPSQLRKAGAIARESEAIHLINMIKDAAETLEEQERELDDLRNGDFG